MPNASTQRMCASALVNVATGSLAASAVCKCGPPVPTARPLIYREIRATVRTVLVLPRRNAKDFRSTQIFGEAEFFCRFELRAGESA